MLHESTVYEASVGIKILELPRYHVLDNSGVLKGLGIPHNTLLQYPTSCCNIYSAVLFGALI